LEHREAEAGDVDAEALERAMAVSASRCVRDGSRSSWMRRTSVRRSTPLTFSLLQSVMTLGERFRPTSMPP
jgi:hypothetical protein